VDGVVGEVTPGRGAISRLHFCGLIKPLREPFLGLRVSGQGVQSLPPVPKGVLFPHSAILLARRE